MHETVRKWKKDREAIKEYRYESGGIRRRMKCSGRISVYTDSEKVV